MADEHLLPDPFALSDRRWVLNTLGADLLAWGAASTPEDVRARLLEERPLPNSDLIFDDLIAKVLKLRHDLSQGDQPIAGVERATTEAMVTFDQQVGMSQVCAFRIVACDDAGAALTDLDGLAIVEGSVEDALGRACWQAYPALLADLWALEGAFDIPALRATWELDERLARWAPRADGKVMISSAGHGRSSYSVDILAAGCLQYARQALQEAKLWPDPERVFEHASEALELLLKMGEGKVVDLPATIGFADVEVPPDLRIETAAGVLEAAGDEGPSVSDWPVGMVLRTTLPVRARAQRMDANWDYRALAGRENYQRTRRRRGDEVVLAFALAFGFEALPRPAWTRLNDPLLSGRSSELHQPPIGAPIAVAAKRIPEVVRWLRALDRLGGTGYDIAIRRTSASLYERDDPQDALIDAVIAWDSLVGASGETTLRVSTGLARLLASTPDAREEVRKAVSDLYVLRFKIVHGATMISASEAARKHHEALEISLRVLRVLLEERPDLVAMSADERSRALLLGA